MKKIICILVSLFAVFSLVSCASDGGNVVGKWETVIDTAKSMSEEDISTMLSLGIDRDSLTIGLIFDFGEDGSVVISTGNNLLGISEKSCKYLTEDNNIFFYNDGEEPNKEENVKYSVTGNKLTLKSSFAEDKIVNLKGFSFPLELTKID